MSVATLSSLVTVPFGLAKYYLHDYILEYGDPRTLTTNWLVKRGLVHSAMIVAIYLAFVTSIGQRLMAKRAPFHMRPILLFYNFSMSAANFVFFYSTLIDSDFGRKIFDFKFPDISDTRPATMAMINLRSYYVISKYFDLFDTIAFVLTKKFGHLTFLHLYHHSSVAFLGSLCLALFPGAQPLALFMIVNSFIHVIMYSYYGLSLLGPTVRRFLWWKRYLTQLQIIQFAIYIAYFTVFVFKQEGYPNFLVGVGYSQAPLFTYLFVQFYRRTYTKDKVTANKLTTKAE